MYDASKPAKPEEWKAGTVHLGRHRIVKLDTNSPEGSKKLFPSGSKKQALANNVFPKHRLVFRKMDDALSP